MFLVVTTCPPRVVSSADGGQVEGGTQVRLTSDTPGVKIYYTVDGDAPDLSHPTTKVFNFNFVYVIFMCEKNCKIAVF